MKIINIKIQIIRSKSRSRNKNRNTIASIDEIAIQLTKDVKFKNIKQNRSQHKL